MFQNFDEPATSAPEKQMRQRVVALRAALVSQGLDGFMVPRGDAHQSEYVAPSDQRLAWISGFTGSAGMAIVLANGAAVFSDGRYTEQMAAQVDAAVFDCLNSADTKPNDWIFAALGSAKKLGYDPWLHTVDQVASLARAAGRAGARLVPVITNPIDQIWTNRPGAPNSPVCEQQLNFAGQSSAAKLKALRATLTQSSQDAVVLTLPDAVAWAFNIRGADIAHVPVALCFAIISQSAAMLFIEPDRVPKAVRAALGPGTTVRPPAAFATALQELGDKRLTVRLDPATGAQQIALHLEGAGAIVSPRAHP
ncbi:MAG: aminopeptidase P family N-terminal domain-containing protein, partial [Hyphomicrobiales bacterium]